MSLIVEQVIKSITSIGEYNDVKISINTEFGYKLEQTVSFIFDVKVYFNGEDFVEKEFVKFTKLQDRKESYKGKEINTTLFNGRHMARYINEALNQ